jgi:hypothetical protein
MTGFKFIRPDEEEPAPNPENGEENAGEQDEDLFFWFFPIRNPNMIAWEATTGSGRATYFSASRRAPM